MAAISSGERGRLHRPEHDAGKHTEQRPSPSRWRAGGERAARRGDAAPSRCGRPGRCPGPSARPLRARRGRSRSPTTRMSGGMPSRAERRQSPAAAGEQDEPDDAADREAQHAVPVAPPDRVPAGRPEVDPRAVAGEVLRELAAQDEHGAEVLERDGEAQLADEGGAPLGVLEGDPADHEQADDHEEHDGDDAGEVDPLHPQRPEGEAAERRGGAGRDPGESRTAQPSRRGAEERWLPSGAGARRRPPSLPRRTRRRSDHLSPRRSRPTPTASRRGAGRRAGRRRRRRRRRGRRRGARP